MCSRDEAIGILFSCVLLNLAQVIDELEQFTKRSAPLMAKFRERCVIFLLVVAALTVLAVLYVNPQLYSGEEGTSQDRHGNSEVYSFSFHRHFMLSLLQNLMKCFFSFL